MLLRSASPENLGENACCRTNMSELKRMAPMQNVSLPFLVATFTSGYLSGAGHGTQAARARFLQVVLVGILTVQRSRPV
jgi:hypothetical protein